MPSEIVLDKKTFGALAIDTRVKVLKSLVQRRKMQSELANELGLAPSTVSEHLERMVDADLIRRRDEGHKWIYYELTEKGKQIVSPERTGVFVFALSVSLFVAVIGVAILYSMGQTPAQLGGKSGENYAPLAGASSPQTAPPDVEAPPLLTQKVADAAASAVNATNDTNKTR